MTLTSIDLQSCVAVTIIDDSVLEETENLTVTLLYSGLLSNRSLLISSDTAIIFIHDDDGETSNTCVLITYSLSPLSLPLSVVDIGFMQSVYTASEHDLSVVVCVQVMKGSLGVPVYLSLSTESINAEGKYHIHTNTCHK